MNNTVVQILLILILVILNGYFAAAEIALVSARRTVLKMEAEEGSARAKAVLRLTEDPSRFMAANSRLGSRLVGFGASSGSGRGPFHPIS